MRLKAIARVSFARSEMTNYDEWAKSNQDLRPGNEVVAFISLTGNQMCFVYCEETIYGKGNHASRVLRSQRLRLRNGTWNPLLLRNYAQEVGLQLDGLKTFAEHYKHLAAAQ